MEKHNHSYNNYYQVPLNFIPGITKPAKSQDNLDEEADMSRARSCTNFFAPLAGYLKRVRSMDCLPVVRRRLSNRDSSDSITGYKNYGCSPNTDQLKRKTIQTSHRKTRSIGHITKMTSSQSSSRDNNDKNDGGLYSGASSASCLECEDERYMHKESWRMSSTVTSSMPDLDYVDIDLGSNFDEKMAKNHTPNNLNIKNAQNYQHPESNDTTNYQNIEFVHHKLFDDSNLLNIRINEDALKRISRSSQYLSVNNSEKRLSNRLSRSSNYLSEIDDELKRQSYRKTRSSEYLSQEDIEMPPNTQLDYLQEVQHELRAKLPKTFITAANIGLTHSYPVMRDMSNATVPQSSLPRSSSKRSLLSKAIFKDVKEGGRSLSKSFSLRGSTKSIDQESVSRSRSSSSAAQQDKNISLFKRARIYTIPK